MPSPMPVTILSDNGSSFYPFSIGWSQPEVLVPRQSGVTEGRFLIVVQVRDYVRLSPATSAGDLLAALSEELAEEVRGGRALLVLDLSNEGPAFRKAIFDGLHQILASRSIPRSATLVVTQNRALASGYANTYGPGTLLFGVHDFFVKMLVVQVDETLGPRFETAQEIAGYAPGVDDGARDFLCMNATPRWHRILIYRYLVAQGLAERGLLSFHGANLLNPKAASLDLAALPPAVARHFGHLLDGLDRWMPERPIRFDKDTRTGNDLAQSLEAWAYRASLYSIVTESDFFEDEPVERVTEKVLKAASLGHPFIVVGNPRSVSFMGELGFETFSSVVDHDYDREQDPSARLRLVFREIERQQAIIAADRAGWIAATREAAAFNFRHARNGLRTRYERLVEMPLLERLSHFVRTGIMR